MKVDQMGDQLLFFRQVFKKVRLLFHKCCFLCSKTIYLSDKFLILNVWNF